MQLQPDPSIAAPVQGVMVRAVLVAALALLAGTLVYLTDRPPGTAWLLPSVPGGPAVPIFGAAGGWLPSFAHTLGFGLLTAALWPGRPRAQRAAVLAWLAVDLAFECGQHPALAPALAASLDASLGPGPAARLLGRYFVAGRFDAADLLASLAGAGLAWVVLGLRRDATRRTG